MHITHFMKHLYLLFIATIIFGANADAQSQPPESAIPPLRSQGLHIATNGCAVVLQWSATIQHGATGFRVQRSADGKEWQEIGQLDATLSSNELRLTDEAPLAGNGNYRLRIEGRDGIIGYSNVCAAVPDCSRTAAASHEAGATMMKQ